ncbi:adenylyltransferase/cytidyltransferase family protein [Sphingobacterium oryzagri]|uniref:Adenylyltransferase/cytidyltransferase family protein n=1 Tax=Sphingobacterium oryzagri TaxID=3025669 RepID=A0ABY7WLL8_9SPHI|nr:adenylyltransferase/cytidyltransferase family protein [Sphingobacterium sp. KACC 22765]WDF70492.1 adenylyltransferase/cytidyltransferase family protein [Sphingobacterium sp. KACC 22765]
MKIGITFGVFDLLHTGHLVMLEEAKRNCDYLIVGLKTDTAEEANDESAAQTVVERFIKLEGCQFVDEILPYASDDDLMDILQSLSVDIRFVGEEHQHTNFTGKSYCQKEGIEIYYTKRKHRFSSDGLRSIVTAKEIAKSFGAQGLGKPSVWMPRS